MCVPAAVRAQQTPPRPAPRPPARADTLPRPARGDTVRSTRDSVTVATPVPRDSARSPIDSVRGVPDSLATRAVIRDSIKAPFARAELPVETRVGPPYRWTRDSLYLSGAVTVADLLDRVPGLTTFRSGWIASAQTAAFLGDFQRVRIFRDGVELDPVDPRNGGLLDLTDVQLWQADEVTIEQAAGEVRVHVRTWTVRNTTPATRVDVSTGDEDTNLYRGFYGKRFRNGLALQIAAQQYGTGARNQRTGGGGDAVGAFTRVGWARGAFTIDGLLTRVDRSRNATVGRRTGQLVLDRFDARRDEAYLRAAYGDPDRGGPWVQLVANALDYELDSPIRAPGDTSATNVDTTAFRAQYVAAGGFTRWGVRLSATNRMRVYDGRTTQAPALRASFDRPWLAVSGLAERTGVDSTTRVDLSARVSPLTWLAGLASISRASTPRSDAAADTRTIWRAELGARLGPLWLTGGRIVRDGGLLAAPAVYEIAGATGVREGQAAGTVASARGRLWRAVYLDAGGTLWDEAGAYRPRYQTRAELGVATNWLSRFPRGDFGLTAAVIDEYRAETPFPVAEGTDVFARVAESSNVFTARIELRIMRAVVSYQLRNAFVRDYQLVPGFDMPGPINFYGVRWEFSN